jgi:putative polyhydroxyalkanoate system protein
VSNISIKRAHHSSVADARKIADKVAAKLAKDYQLTSNWDGDTLHFSRSGVNGTLAVGAKEFSIDAKLGFLMAAFKAPIQAAIEENLTKLLSEKVAAKTTSKAVEKDTKKISKR